MMTCVAFFRKWSHGDQEAAKDCSKFWAGGCGGAVVLDGVDCNWRDSANGWKGSF